MQGKLIQGKKCYKVKKKLVCQSRISAELYFSVSFTSVIEKEKILYCDLVFLLDLVFTNLAL